MRALNRWPVAAAIVTLSATSALAAEPIVYPAKQQTPAQQQKDVAECGAWATQNTGIDPVAVASTPVAPPPVAAAPPPPPQGPQGERLRGAVRGAAAGAVVGEIADNDADKGAATGAAVGAMAGGARARQNRRAQEQAAGQQQQQAAEQQQAAQQQAEAQKQQQIATYNRAKTACLEGRGYTVK